MKLLNIIKLLLAYLFILFLFFSCKNLKNDSWKEFKRIQLEEGFTPVGIANYAKYIVVSDSINSRILMIDWVLNKTVVDFKVNKPVYINVRNGRMLIPSFTDNSVYVYRGKNLYSLSSFIPIDQPTGVDAFSAFHYAHVDQGQDRVLYLNGHNHQEYIIGGEGTDPGKFNDPSNVIIWDDMIYVVDSGNKRVQVFSSHGEFKFSFGEKEQLEWPTGIAHSESQIFVSDMPTHRVLVYEKTGELTETISRGHFKPSDISFFEGRLYIADQEKSHVIILEKE